MVQRRLGEGWEKRREEEKTGADGSSSRVRSPPIFCSFLDNQKKRFFFEAFTTSSRGKSSGEIF